MEGEKFKGEFMLLCISQTSVVSPKGMVTPSRVLSSKSWDNRAKGNISNSRQKSQLKLFRKAFYN